MKTTISTILFAILLSMTSISFAEYEYYNDDELNDQDVIIDLFMVRPLGIVGSAFGITMHTFGLLFSVPGENFSETAETLVEDPLNYTFNRPVGRFEEDHN